MSHVFLCTGVMEAKMTCHTVLWTSFWLISYSRELYNKNYIFGTSETLII